VVRALLSARSGLTLILNGNGSGVTPVINERYKFVNKVYGVHKVEYNPPTTALGYLRLLGAANEALSRATSSWGKTYWSNVVAQIKRKADEKINEKNS
jgi:hypothetical protein